MEGQVVYADVNVETFMQDEMKLVVPPNHPLLRTKEINESTLQVGRLLVFYSISEKMKIFGGMARNN
ncbi:hypothetical protein bcgnr5369_68470 [Bacillus cereus]